MKSTMAKKFPLITIFDFFGHCILEGYNFDIPSSVLPTDFPIFVLFFCVCVRACVYMCALCLFVRVFVCARACKCV